MVIFVDIELNLATIVQMGIKKSNFRCRCDKKLFKSTYRLCVSCKVKALLDVPMYIYIYIYVFYL